MANIFTSNKLTGSEKILFKRDSNTDRGILNKTGVLVIDPNSVENDYNQIVDRYVKQEDLVIYSSLKVLKKSENSITDDNGKRSVTNDSTPIQINFLNPIKNKTANGQTRKEYMTNDWVDFMTSDASNDKTSSSYILDPETFGISHIDISVNANHVPRVNITFIDVQGRSLFERGNDPDNPYNIFFTYPYPKFLLTYKGYYGKAVEVPLVLFKSNTRFDPSSGNYEISAEFQSDIFSLMNSFVTIYPYVTPYMFLMDDGMYLGQKILNTLYNKQNAQFKSTLSDSDYQKYEITTNPSLWDLANAIKKIPFKSLGGAGQQDASASNNDTVINIKTTIEQIDLGIRNLFDDTRKYIIASSLTSKNPDGVQHTIFKPANPSYLIKTNSPIELIQYFSSFNKEINNIGSLDTQQNNYTDNLRNRINKNASLSPLKLDITNLLTSNVFTFDNQTNTYTLENYDTLVSIVLDEISKIQTNIENTYIDDTITDIKNVIGYEPNLGNILRIITNNMQAFLILLDIISKNAIKQLQTDNNRIKKHICSTTYKTNIAGKVNYLSAFPNYYKTIKENGDDKHVLAFPAVDETNNNWFEVAFVEEIYLALNRLKEIAHPGKNSALFGAKNTGLSTIFALGENDLVAYEGKTQANDILAELMFKYSLHSSFSGLLYRGLSVDDLSTYYSSNVAKFETDLIEKLVIAKLNTTNSKFLLATVLKNATGKNTWKTNLGSVGRDYIKLNDAANTYKKILTNSIDEIIMYRSRYDNTTFSKKVAARNKTVNDNITNRVLYNKLYNVTLSPLKYSFASQEKTNILSVYADLRSNVSYYCDVDTTTSLYGINKGITNVDTKKYDTNSFQGFISNMNEKLAKMNETVNTDFLTNVSYGKKTVPALTYSSVVNNSSVFLHIDAPKKNIIQKYQNAISV